MLNMSRSLDTRRLGSIRRANLGFCVTTRRRMNHEPNIYGTDGDASKGAAVYTPLALALYDLAVLRISNSFVWKCPSQVLLDFYNQHISDKHLDIGVGTGYFLDKCRFPSTAPTIALFDLNPHSLARSAKRLRRYNPSCYLGNALQRIDISMSGFDSISLNYLLHCLPGNLASKSIVFEHVKPLLRDGGVIFGSTILGEGVRHNPLAKQLIKIYNAKGFFSNLSDRQSDLEAGLKAHFDEHTIHIVGCVALFSARKRIARAVAGGQKGTW
jgi:SAM-dependent methyltransferase